VIGLARGLGLGTIAEGVEHLDQAMELRRLGCDAAQGFLFSPAVPASQIAPLLGRDFLASDAGSSARNTVLGAP
jgi:EAL domain-containing protein (putative c-di-GMP-specific phosphodiesterase class I)